MAGGIHSWNGMRATGLPKSGMTYFSSSHSPEEFIALSWVLEDGSQQFYAKREPIETNSEARDLFSKLQDAEGHHKASLEKLYTELTGKEKGEGFPWGILDENPDVGVMEGGMKIDEAMKWLEGKGPEDTLELLMSLEVNSYDLYIKVGRSVDNDESKKVFLHLAEEEKQHLARLTEMLDKLVAK